MIVRPALLRAFAIPTIVVAMIAGSSYAIGPITLYVDAGSGCSSGCGGQAAPYPAIQAAIDDANGKIGGGLATEATIVVAPGTYAENLFVFPGVHVQCDSPSTVTINATGSGRAAVILGSLGTGRAAINFSIDGCTITGGIGEVRSTLIGGGGVYVSGDPVVSNNVIRDNVISGPRDDYAGGGIYVGNGDPVISGNTIMRNIADPPPLGGQDNSFGLGGGIYVLGQFSGANTHPQIVDNIFLDNFAGGEVGKGGAIRIDGNPGALISRNAFIGNRASHSGGGIEAYNDLTISDNLIYGNSALLFGGGIDSLQSSIQITNNTIVGNGLTATAAPSGYYFANYGGGIHLRALIPQVPPEIRLTNNLFSGNTIHQSGAGAGIYSLNSYPVTTYNDSHANLKLPGAGSHIEGDFSDIDFLTMTGNISQNPGYANAPLFTDVTVAAGTTTTVRVLDASRYTVNQKIEYNDDGVLRTVTAVNASTDVLTFTPPLPSSSKDFKLVADWNVVSTASEDFRLTAGSPAIDAGDGSAVSALDLDGNPRISDGDNNGSSIVDVGAYELPGLDGDGDGFPPGADCDDTDPDVFPGAVEACNGIDDDCDTLVDEGFADSDADGLNDCLDPDDDNDLVEDALDCAPLVNSIQTVPGPAGSSVRARSSAPFRLGWLKESQANVYHIYRGGAGPGPGTDVTASLGCFISESPDNPILDPQAPALGTAFVYLVEATGPCGQGGIGNGSNGLPRINPAVCAPLGADSDADLVTDIADDCPLAANVAQADGDLDNVGTVCDNCPILPNPDQADQNDDGVGNACDPSFDQDGDGFPLSVDCDDQNPSVHPGAPELCDSLDNDCDGTPDNAAPPPVVTSLTLVGDDLSWAPIAGPAVYDVVSGGLDGLADAGMTALTSGCVADDTPGNTLLLQGAPLLGDGFWYVVRAADCGGSGSFGSRVPPLSPSRDEAIALSGNDCAP